VFSTETATQLPWPALPGGYAWGGAQFLDDNSLLVGVDDPRSTSWVSYRITEKAVTPLASGTGYKPAAGAIGSRWLLRSDGATLSVSDLAGGAPVMLSTNSAGVLSWNDALTEIAFFEGPVDPASWQATRVLARSPTENGARASPASRRSSRAVGCSAMRRRSPAMRSSISRASHRKDRAARCTCGEAASIASSATASATPLRHVAHRIDPSMGLW
jgi:hypothetical protein